MQYFSLLEFTRSITANIRGLDNTPPPDVVHNIQWLCRQFLDPLREAVGCPVIISSGYRCRDLNTAVGGSPTSYHLLGLAADFHPLDPERRDDVIALVREAKVRARSKERLTDYQTGRLADDSLGEGSQAEVLSDSLPVCKSDSLKVAWDQFIIYPTFFHVAVSPEGSAQKLQILRYNGFGQGYQKD